MPRLFVAVWPPDEVVERIAALDRPSVPGLRWTTPDQWHVTLRFLGQVPEPEEVVAAMAGLSESSGSSAVEAGAGPAIGRFDQRVLHLPVAGLQVLAGEVLRATAHLGRPPDDRPFSGHLTLARTADRAKVDLRPLTGTPFAASWTVGEVSVVESRLSSAGARYAVIERIPLLPPPNR
ncbi:MAG TPA: RNA 2',3'-cyclic phosphodiesterase [Acidimicrobiales bacterium]|jgi:2'-5' RNA ligase|nr:RNA 2',3'-cyclic phosphodiesterase [Acidimicrobiales bacterium]